MEQAEERLRETKVLRRVSLEPGNIRAMRGKNTGRSGSGRVKAATAFTGVSKKKARQGKVNSLGRTGPNSFSGLWAVGDFQVPNTWPLG